MTPIPRYDELPVGDGRPHGSAWGVFGDDDEIGTLNLLTPERLRAAAGLVRRGEVYSLNWDVELPRPAILGRRDLEHTALEDEVGRDDAYDRFYPQASSQWDGLTHVRHPDHGFYNDRPVGAPEAGVLGIQHWARRGIAGRFVLADVARAREARGEPLDHRTRTPVPAAEIEEVLDAQGTRLSGGDILLVRFGWIGWYESIAADERAALAEAFLFPTAGLAPDEDTARWLWDRAVAAVGADNPALEAMPFDQSHVGGFVHYRLIPLLGMAIAEMLALDALAAACAADGVYDGLFTAAPMNKTGAAGSPANALAIR